VSPADMHEREITVHEALQRFLNFLSYRHNFTNNLPNIWIPENLRVLFYAGQDGQPGTNPYHPWYGLSTHSRQGIEEGTGPVPNREKNYGNP
jgi:hypothetical protein